MKNLIETLENRKDYREGRMNLHTKRCLLKQHIAISNENTTVNRASQTLTDYFNDLKINHKTVKSLIELNVSYESRLTYGINIAKSKAYSFVKEHKMGSFKNELIKELKQLLLGYKESSVLTPLEKFHLEGLDSLTLREKVIVSSQF